MDKFRKLWEPVDRVVFGTVRHLCELMLAALVAVVFSSSVPYVGRTHVSVSSYMDEHHGIFSGASDR